MRFGKYGYSAIGIVKGMNEMSRGEPREQYERTYVLLPPQAGAEWAKAVIDGAWERRRYTVGGSADDAGIGDLDYRRIIAVNPDRWSGDLFAFFRDHYSGVGVVTIDADTPSTLAQMLAEMDDDDGPEPALGLRVGINDPDNQGAGYWLRGNAPHSLLYVPLGIGEHARTLDFSAEAQAGARVVVNLRWGWSTDCGGSGTFPPQAETEAFVRACQQTIAQSAGVWGWTIGNEANNPREWPQNERVLPDDAARVYNWVRNGAQGVNLAPSSIDPYNATLMCCREYFRYLWALIDDAEFADLHGYIRGPNPALVNSDARFSDAPLQWQYLNYWGCCETLAAELPPGLPVIVSEFNHIWKTNEVVGDCGWVTDSRARHIILAAYNRAADTSTRNPVTAVCVYRWRGNDWAICENQWALDAIAQLGRA